MTNITNPSINQNSFDDVLITGNPNTGKTSVFNSLTGLHQKTGNYPGVTVEKKMGMVTGSAGQKIRLHDLPGMYSLVSKSPDELIARKVLLNETDEKLNIRLIVVVVDASNLNRNLYLATQLIDLGLPILIAMNMIDNAKNHGFKIDFKKLSEQLGVAIVPIVASKSHGLKQLSEEIFDQVQSIKKQPPKLTDSPAESKETKSTHLPGYFSNLFPQHKETGDLLDGALSPVVMWFRRYSNLNESGQHSEALRVISSEEALENWSALSSEKTSDGDLKTIINKTRAQLNRMQISWKMLETIMRYDKIDKICLKIISQNLKNETNPGMRLDKFLTHRFLGPVMALVIFYLIFQSIFTWAEKPMEMIEGSMGYLGSFVKFFIPDGLLQDLFVDGIIGGVGAILVFLPQIIFLFFFLALLEDTGYMARVAFLADRLMKSIGLSGYGVIPLLSSFACAIPGIMATRTVPNWKERIIIIMIAPLMSCSARLPVYILLIGTFFPSISILGIFSISGIILFSMYLFGIIVGIGVALVFKRIIKNNATSTSFVMELPPYRMPSLKWVLFQMFERAKIFVTDAGQIILAISIVIWFLVSFPKSDNHDKSHLQQSYAGQIGTLIEPAIQPLGFDWKVGIGLITSFVAREVLVSTLATIYNVKEADETSVNLRIALQNETNVTTGKRVYTPLVAVSIMVFFALACQCMATVAIVKRETNSWRWPIIMVLYMTGLAYVSSFVVYQGGLLLGFT